MSCETTYTYHTVYNNTFAARDRELILWGSSNMAIDSWENIRGCVKNHKRFAIYVANHKHKHQWCSQVELVGWMQLNS